MPSNALNPWTRLTPIAHLHFKNTNPTWYLKFLISIDPDPLWNFIYFLNLKPGPDYYRKNYIPAPHWYQVHFYNFHTYVKYQIGMFFNISIHTRFYTQVAAHILVQ